MEDIFINSEGYIELHPVGDLSFDYVKEMSLNVSKMATSLKDEGKKSIILANLTDVTSVNPIALGLSSAAIKDIEYDRLACFGASPVVSTFVNGVFSAVGDPTKVRLFQTRSEAEAWLKL